MSWSVSIAGEPEHVVEQLKATLKEQNPKEELYALQYEHMQAIVSSVADFAYCAPDGMHVSVEGSGHVNPDGGASGYLSIDIFRPVADLAQTDAQYAHANVDEPLESEDAENLEEVMQMPEGPDAEE